MATPSLIPSFSQEFTTECFNGHAADLNLSCFLMMQNGSLTASQPTADPPRPLTELPTRASSSKCKPSLLLRVLGKVLQKHDKKQGFPETQKCKWQARQVRRECQLMQELSPHKIVSFWVPGRRGRGRKGWKVEDSHSWQETLKVCHWLQVCHSVAQ